MQTAKNRKIGYKELTFSIISLSVIFVLLLLSLVILFDPALGWFADNRIVTAEGPGIVINSGEAYAEYECYVYNGLRSTVETQSISGLNMQPYDMIFSKRNRYTPAIIRIALSRLGESYSNSGTLEITIKRDTSLPNNTLNNRFSSIMRMTAAVGNTYYSSDINTIYSNIDAALYTTVKGYPQNYSSASSKVFTTVTGGTGTELDPFTYSKADSITLTVPYTSADKNGDVLNVYLYLSYDEALVRKYRAAEGIDTSSTVIGRTISMTNDIESITISFS